MAEETWKTVCVCNFLLVYKTPMKERKMFLHSLMERIDIDIVELLFVVLLVLFVVLPVLQKILH